jgi:hypothetical protein
MADAPEVHIGENSAEGVAYKLLTLIRQVEAPNSPKDRKGILDLYAECLNTVRSPHVRGVK